MNTAEETVNRIVRNAAPPVPATPVICPRCLGACRDMDRKGAPFCEVCHGWGVIRKSLNVETALSE
jgi:DnaJ-class molecular chaperone